MIFSSKTKWLSLLLLGIITIPIWLALLSEKSSDYLTVNFFDVGQGDAIFIEAPNHNQVLIDGGPGSAVLSQLGTVMPFYDREIDLVVSTHPDSDHLSGLVDVLEQYKVNQVLTTGVKGKTKEFEKWQELLKNKNIIVEIAQAGQMIKLSENVSLNILSPREDFNGKPAEDLNNTSIVGKLIYGDFEVMLAGDAEKKEEDELLNSNINLDSDILKVGHHGSKNSTSARFLQEVFPEAAVIQVGANNRYRHPSEEVLERLEGVKMYRTDQNGRIEVRSNGRGYIVKTHK